MVAALSTALANCLDLIFKDTSQPVWEQHKQELIAAVAKFKMELRASLLIGIVPEASGSGEIDSGDRSKWLALEEVCIDGKARISFNLIAFSKEVVSLRAEDRRNEAALNSYKAFLQKYGSILKDLDAENAAVVNDRSLNTVRHKPQTAMKAGVATQKDEEWFRSFGEEKAKAEPTGEIGERTASLWLDLVGQPQSLAVSSDPPAGAEDSTIDLTFDNGLSLGGPLITPAEALLFGINSTSTTQAAAANDSAATAPESINIESQAATSAPPDAATFPTDFGLPIDLMGDLSSTSENAGLMLDFDAEGGLGENFAFGDVLSGGAGVAGLDFGALAFGPQSDGNQMADFGQSYGFAEHSGQTQSSKPESARPAAGQGTTDQDTNNESVAGLGDSLDLFYS
ncbi:hypothetical protein BJ742DRAFT_789930 [Cladochytrium replicatum]|nr:hypothetical protein BJ742DRAFT_789930 [Cladochytrium replicatum]